MSLLPSLLLRMHSTSNNANGNKPVIFSSIAWYYDDNDFNIISLHSQMRTRLVVYTDTASCMTCSTKCSSYELQSAARLTPIDSHTFVLDICEDEYFYCV